MFGGAWEKFSLREASGSLTAAETVDAVITGTNIYNELLWHLNITTMTCTAGEEVDFFLQTTYDGGNNWHDLACKHYDNDDNGTASVDLVTYVAPGMSKINFATTDGTMADDTVSYALPLGESYRIKTAITNTPAYAYSSLLVVKQSGTAGHEVTGGGLAPIRLPNTVAASQTDDAYVTAVTGRIIRVHQYIAHCAGTATTVTFNSKGSGAGTAISHPIYAGANGGESPGFTPMGWFDTNVGEALTTTTGAGSNTGILIGYSLV